MTRVRMILQYDGTGYEGWQRQLTGLGVQQVVEEEIEKLTGEKIVVHASGRTDSGVHALAQVAHFDTASRIPPEKFAYALNAGLPRDIRVAYSDEAEGFHARFDVVRKHYRYRLQHSPHADPFTRNTALHVYGPLDVAAMNEAAAAILGEHDFMAFKASGIEPESTVRTIYESRWTDMGRLVVYDVAGSGFLYNMVRILAGTMVEIGMGRRDAASMQRAL
ncbi:MAG TPA: tRNA pseudouridine(38-40) synthase TruA, partial [Clostridia bacterium]|nr:tRNA pseudouridine(38-40) synthase TruA [Clostridia bacterium]